jgi:threonine aldolase
MSSQATTKQIDLRSDTVTRPTAEMREAMARAEVGDDVFGDDPTVERLEAMSAERMGKAAALFVPSGTMGNLTAVMTHCGRGDEVILGRRAHTFLYEAGGIAALGGVHPHALENRPDGTLDLDEIENAVRDADDVHQPATRLICLENTHNSCGGVPLSAEYTRAVGALARRHDIRLHIDGARIFNAAAALGVDPGMLVEPADSVMFCLSKALSAPVGSLLVGDRAFIDRARHIRKQLGGGLRQVGVLAAPGIVALETMVARIENDHRRAKMLAEGLKTLDRVIVDPELPPSNMVFMRLEGGTPREIAELKRALDARGIMVSSAGPSRLRMVPHRGIVDDDIARAIGIFKDLLR